MCQSGELSTGANVRGASMRASRFAVRRWTLSLALCLGAACAADQGDPSKSSDGGADDFVSRSEGGGSAGVAGAGGAGGSFDSGGAAGSGGTGGSGGSGGVLADTGTGSDGTVPDTSTGVPDTGA